MLFLKTVIDRKLSREFPLKKTDYTENRLHYKTIQGIALGYSRIQSSFKFFPLSQIAPVVRLLESGNTRKVDNSSESVRGSRQFCTAPIYFLCVVPHTDLFPPNLFLFILLHVHLFLLALACATLL